MASKPDSKAVLEAVARGEDGAALATEAKGGGGAALDTEALDSSGMDITAIALVSSRRACTAFREHFIGMNFGLQHDDPPDDSSSSDGSMPDLVPDWLSPEHTPWGDRAAIIIQCAWRCCMARKKHALLASRDAVYARSMQLVYLF